MNIMIIALGSIVFSVAAQFILKAGMSSAEVQMAMSQSFAPRNLLVILTNKFVISGFVLYGLSAVVWLRVLAQWDVSKAYPLVGLGFALTVVVGLILGEQVTGLRAFGVLLVCAGIMMIASS
jgi:multidrug transporter EmrE-like cation transporter